MSSIDQHQHRVAAWMLECFGAEITADKVERTDRFVEEAIELAQATGYGADRAHALVNYVFSRPVGEIGQEVGGVMVTLAALCNVHRIWIRDEFAREIDRITTPEMVAKIRAKQAVKPTGSTLPIVMSPNARPPTALSSVIAERERQIFVEGYSEAHDDEHERGELALAAASYAVLGGLGFEPITAEMRAWFERVWPFEERPNRKGQRRDLVRAAALLLAEIERVDRAEARK